MTEIRLAELDLDHYAGNGFLCVDLPLPAETMEACRSACERVIEKTRSGNWPYVRNWPYNHFANTSDFWGAGHMLHPELEEPIFGEVVACSGIVGVVGALLKVGNARLERDLQLELVNLLVNPLRDFEIGWHRDLVRGDLDADAELTALQQPNPSVQWNYALFEDECLLVIPSSHTRPKTAEERAAFTRKDFAPLPDEYRVFLKPCQAVFYNNNLLHRGTYSATLKRRTLHGCMGIAGRAVDNYELYSDLAWMEDRSTRELLPLALRPYYDNFVRAMVRQRQNLR